MSVAIETFPTGKRKVCSVFSHSSGCCDPITLELFRRLCRITQPIYDVWYSAFCYK